MIDLRKIYFEVKKLINYQYPIIDNLLWRLVPEIRFSLLLINEKETDILVIFIERDGFNQYLRSRRIITGNLNSKLNIGMEVVLLSS